MILRFLLLNSRRSALKRVAAAADLLTEHSALASALLALRTSGQSRCLQRVLGLRGGWGFFAMSVQAAWSSEQFKDSHRIALKCVLNCPDSISELRVDPLLDLRFFVTETAMASDSSEIAMTSR